MYKLTILIIMLTSLLQAETVINNVSDSILINDSSKTKVKIDKVELEKNESIKTDSTITVEKLIETDTISLINEKTEINNNNSSKIKLELRKQDTSIIIAEIIKNDTNNEKVDKTQMNNYESKNSVVKKKSNQQHIDGIFKITDAVDIMIDSIIQQINITENKPIIAVHQFSGDNKDISNAVSEYTVVDLSQKKMNIVSKEDYKKAIDEISLSQTGLTDEKLAPQVGHLVSATHILTGSVHKIGAEQIVTMKVTSVKEGKIIYAINSKVTDINSPDIISLITKERKSVSSYIFRSAIPGGGQFYADRNIRGTIWATLFAAGAIYSGYSIYKTSEALNDRDEYWKTMPQPNSYLSKSEVETYDKILYPKYLSLHDTYEEKYNMSIIAVSVTAGVWLLNVVDAAIIGVSESKKVDLYFSSTNNSYSGLVTYNF